MGMQLVKHSIASKTENECVDKWLVWISDWMKNTHTSSNHALVLYINTISGIYNWHCNPALHDSTILFLAVVMCANE